MIRCLIAVLMALAIVFLASIAGCATAGTTWFALRALNITAPDYVPATLSCIAFYAVAILGAKRARFL